MSDQKPTQSALRRFALWLTIATLVVAGLLGGYFIIFGDQANVAARAWLTLLLLAAFAGAVVFDGSLPDGPNRWYLTASTMLNIFLVLIGLIKVWGGPLQPDNTYDGWVWGSQFNRWLGLVLVVRAALMVTQLWVHHFIGRASNSVTRRTAWLTVAFVWLTAIVFVIPLSFPNLKPLGLDGYADWWWRIAGATALVMTVTLLIPLVVRAFAPKAPRSPQPAGSFEAREPLQSPPRYPPATPPEYRPATAPPRYPPATPPVYPPATPPQTESPQTESPQKGQLPPAPPL